MKTPPTKTRKRGRPPAAEPMVTQPQFRLPQDLAAKIDAYQESMTANLPGLRLNRSDVIRDLIQKGLEAAERGVRLAPTR
jgi:Arc/MetJ-type ribon-helix-helix transcriptional regulator